MCTAVTYQTRDFYFGRTLDHDISYGEEVTITPRRFPLRYREAGVQETRYAIIGMARVAENYPLYFDAVNEKGLAMAGLNFVGFAAYGQSQPGRDNIAHFELIPWVLSRCACVREARKLLERLNITCQPFSSDLPPAQLHWILADREEAITLEAMADGLHIHTNPVGVLTNNPPFDDQLRHLTDFMQLSPEPPVNRLFPAVNLEPYSRGLGAMGLPGDFSSQSRFVRAAFVRQTSVSGESEAESVSQFFRILGAVSQPRGCCRPGNGQLERTLYTSCCNTDKGIYYYQTYGNHQITAVHLHREPLDSESLIRYPLIQTEQVREEN